MQRRLSMKVTIDGEVNYEVDGWSTHITIHLKKPIPFIKKDALPDIKSPMCYMEHTVFSKLFNEFIK